MEIQFFMPTKLVMGTDCILNKAEELKSLGKKALIVTGRGSAKKNGSLDDVTTALSKNAQTYEIYDKVMANPTIDCVYEGASVAKLAAVDFVIAIGGGSPMDAAKAISLLACQEIPREKLFSGDYEVRVLPMAFVPTTAGTGSEATQYSILTNDELKTKTILSAPALFPKVAFLDSKYMEALPKATAINTAIDALSHAIEGSMSIRANCLTDVLAFESMRLIAGQLKNLNYFMLTKEDRDKLLYASTLGGMVIAQTGTTSVHAMGYSLTYFKDIDHGRANGLLLAEFMKLVEKQKPDRIRMILDAMGYASIEEFETLVMELLGEKETLTQEEIEYYATLAIKTKNNTNCIVVPTKEDLLRVYKTVFQV